MLDKDRSRNQPRVHQSAMPGIYQRGSFEEWAQRTGASLATQIDVLHEAVAALSEERGAVEGLRFAMFALADELDAARPCHSYAAELIRERVKKEEASADAH